MAIQSGEQGIRPGLQGRGDHLVYEEVNVFSLTQRLNRLRYCCYFFTGALILGLLLALLAILAQAAPPLVARILLGLVVLLGLAFFIWTIGLMVRRLHDLGRAGWWVLAVLIPGVNLVFMLYLLVGAPENGVNRFGTPNPPNSLLVNVVGGFLWFLQVLSGLLNLAVVLIALVRPEWLLSFQQDYLPPEFQQQLRQLEQLQQRR